MPVVRWTSVVLLCAAGLFGCRGAPPACPIGNATADPRVIPDGDNQTTLSVEVFDPSPELGLTVVTELSATNGTIADPRARSTTFACPFDFTGEAEICVTTTYEGGGEDGLAVDAALKRRGPNVYLQNPLECTTTRCSTVVCPEEKNRCPEVSELMIDPDALEEGESATITVIASDPDDNPEPLTTLVTARHGEIEDPTAHTTTYTCDENVGGVIEICVVASDGDPSCDVQRCASVLCPGDPLENTCPIIESLTAIPTEIESPGTMTTVSVVANDPDDFPIPLRTELTANTGVFADRFASETTFTCGAPGPVELCVRANDGDSSCDETSCTTVQCPDEIPSNICPQLFVINGVPRVVPEGEDRTLVQTRGQDTDGVPLPLVLTLNALWGTFENTDNIQRPFNVVEQDATYVCDRPGPVEICVDATDGACTKTLCDQLFCPDSVGNP